MHYYNFPPYSVGETRPMRAPGRREIGHGALAERALVPVLPPEEDFPYTLRLISEVLESNGSSSMASVCGSTLALMDAGVPIKKHVAGVAMGLILHGEKYAILTDIQGLEDALGEMDFKVAGTVDGITAIQMDIKVAGITIEIMREAMAEAKKSRLFIIDKLKETIPEARTELSPYAPRMIVLHDRSRQDQRRDRTRRQGHQQDHRRYRREDRHRERRPRLHRVARRRRRRKGEADGRGAHQRRRRRRSRTWARSRA